MINSFHFPDRFFLPAGPIRPDYSRWLQPFLAWALLGTLLSVPAAGAEKEAWRLGDERQVNDLQHVRLTLKVRGKLLVEPPSGEEEGEGVTSVEIGASGQLAYQERLVKRIPSDAPSALLAARYYEIAQARLRVGGHDEAVRLGDGQRLVIAESGPRWAMSSEVPLSRQELDMLTVPCSTLDVHRLLPEKSVQIGETWPPASEDLAAVLNLDEVTVNETRSRLVDVARGLARIQIAGTVAGHVKGAATQLKITGDYRYDLRWNRINWVQLAIQESRDSSPTHPGFDVTAELRMLVEPLEESPELDLEALSPMLAHHDGRRAVLRFESDSGAYRLMHELGWQLMDDRPHSTSWRMVAKNRSIAQCNVRRLRDLEPGKTLGLEEFQADIEQALGDRFGNFEQARKLQRPDEHEVLQVTVHGAVADVPIRWVYYHIASPSGRRASFVFTMAQDSSEKFGASDRLLVKSLELLAMNTDAEKGDAEKGDAEKGDAEKGDAEKGGGPPQEATASLPGGHSGVASPSHR